ncbi:hypothetical protein D3C73_1577730 [compost metagenome]
MYQREREFAGTERFFRQAQHDDRVLAAGKQQCRVGAFSGHFTHDVDGFRFQPVQMLVAGVVEK